MMRLVPGTSVTLPASDLEKLSNLADLLARASRLAREIGQARTRKSLSVPELKRPKTVPKDQAWFWSKKWQRGEREANADLRAGRYKAFERMDDLIVDLDL